MLGSSLFSFDLAKVKKVPQSLPLLFKHSCRFFLYQRLICCLSMYHTPLLCLTRTVLAMLLVSLFNCLIRLGITTTSNFFLLDCCDFHLQSQAKAIRFKIPLLAYYGLFLPRLNHLNCHCPPPGRQSPDAQFKLTSQL